VTADAVHEKDHEREENAIPQFGDLENVLDTF
jgi:hypothetical protein